jgi:isoamylase
MTLTTLPGESFPLGAIVRDGGVNFCLYAKGATGVELLLFDHAHDPQPRYCIPLDPAKNRTFHYWHIFIPGLAAEQIYGYRVAGPYNPDRGLRFDRNKVLLDPYTRAIVGWRNYSREAAIQPGDNVAQALRSVVVDPSTYDWEGDEPLKIPYAETVIYELHVGGFTRNPNSNLPSEQRGTFAGVIQKIPYLKSLGITAVELMPVQQFDQNDAPLGKENYWGYSTMAFFAPHRQYSLRRDRIGPVDEFRDMVKALHREGIEVILDVVFNHTAEGNHTGPTLSFRGLSNEDYYILDNHNKALYKNYSGCGNTVKMGTISGNLILDCLRYWVAEMHVDGFRFDLAAVLSRSIHGEPLEDPPILWMINSDPVLAGTKIIAEAWDAAGLYQVGQFAGERFAEWNGPYRDDVRQFVKGDAGKVGALADRILGSPDIYPDPEREPNHSIHFITCHDGFTLHDLVAYGQKYNLANGEANRDGSDANWSWNCGVEGPTDIPSVNRLRHQQIKNFLTIWAMSQGTPMLLMGDEVLRSQLGNNNAYCQNNPLSWFDWQALERNADMLRFTRHLIHLIQSLAVFKHSYPLIVTPQAIQEPCLTWHGVKLGQPDWRDCSRSLAFTLRYLAYGEQLQVMFNAYWEPLVFELPPLPLPLRWHRIIDTALLSPDDFCPPAEAPPVETDSYGVKGRSSVVLMAL